MNRLRSAFLVAALALAGCTSGSYAPVSGTVTYHGKPVAGASVVFAPDPAADGAAPATAVTGADGSFTLRTNLPGGVTRDGAGVGVYKVTVSKYVPPGGMSEEQYAKKLEAADSANKPYSADSGVPPKVELLPREFTDVSVTKVSATVTSGKNEVMIEIP